jgi:hypothetical protein
LLTHSEKDQTHPKLRNLPILSPSIHGPFSIVCFVFGFRFKVFELLLPRVAIGVEVF